MKTLLSAALLSFAALPAVAEDIHLTRANAGQTFAYDGVLMSVYYTEGQDDAAEVVATYTPYVGGYDPKHLRMSLAEGDSVSFGLPNAPAIRYTFARDAEAVTVSAEQVWLNVASR